MEWLWQRFQDYANRLAIASARDSVTYNQLLTRIRYWHQMFQDQPKGQVVALISDYHGESIAAFLALAASNQIIVPLAPDSQTQHEDFCQLASVQQVLDLREQSSSLSSTGVNATHPLFQQLRDLGHPGLVLFTSGSSGHPKAVVHDLDRILEKFQSPRHAFRTLLFLQFDHIGGLNTLLYTLANGGAAIIPPDRYPHTVCSWLERFQVELLPTSPTFLNLLLLSDALTASGLPHLRRITYGTEPMSTATLERLHALFPKVELQQTYGMSELGILRSRSRDSASLWVRLGGEGFDTKVVEGVLWVRARSAMLGYLNAPSPFDAEGFLNTGDEVEVDGDYFRILGRAAQRINVGGLKVSPTEVETVLMDMSGVLDAAVRGEAHPLTGQIVTARIRLDRPESTRDFKTRMREFCKNRLPNHAIPVKVSCTQEPLHNARFKKVR